jgi:hypothetical protein
MDSKFNAIISASGQTRRLSNVGMSASPLTPDIGLRRSEPTLRAKLGSRHDATSRFKLVGRPVLLV